MILGETLSKVLSFSAAVIPMHAPLNIQCPHLSHDHWRKEDV